MRSPRLHGVQATTGRPPRRQRRRRRAPPPRPRRRCGRRPPRCARRRPPCRQPPRRRRLRHRPQSSRPPSAGDPFDGFTLLRDFYGRLGVDPFSAAELVDQAAPGSTAEAFLYHEVGVAIAIFDHTSAPLPAYTVTQTGPAVSVCRDDGVCETFGDFVAVAGALDTFTLDGQPMDDRAGSYQRLTTVEALTLDASFGVRRPRDELLSVVALLTAEGGGTTFAWEQTAYVDATGQQLPIDVATSLYPAAHRGRRFRCRPRPDSRRRRRRSAGRPDHHRPHRGPDHDPHSGAAPAMTARSPLVVLGTLAISTAAAVAGVAGYPAAGITTEATSAPSTTVGSAVLDAVDLFTDLFTSLGGDPPNRGNLDQHVVPGSPAAAWVDYCSVSPRPVSTAGQARSSRSPSPRAPRPSTVTAVDVCTEGFCDEFSGFVVDDEGGCSRSSSTASPSTIAWLRRRSRSQKDDLGRRARRLRAGHRRRARRRPRHHPRRRGARQSPGRTCDYHDPAGDDIPVDLAASAYPRSVGPVGAQAVVLQFPLAELGGEVVLTYTTESTSHPSRSASPSTRCSRSLVDDVRDHCHRQPAARRGQRPNRPS